jgi:flavin reductase (DIM6/NTAB) family NADH-FMN oxidoreductase RutF
MQMSDDTVGKILRRFPYGFYSLASRRDDEVNAMVLTWIIQASFEPRLLAIALQRTSHTYTLVKEGRAFAVNLFQHGDFEIIRPLTKGREKDPDKMSEVEYSPAPETGCPVLQGASAYVECKVLEIFETGGDHDIVLAKVVGGASFQPGEAEDTLTLREVGWNYGG